MNKKIIYYIGGFKMPDKNAAAIRVRNNAILLQNLGYEVKLIGLSDELKSNSARTSHFQFESWQIKYPRKFREWVSYLTSIKILLHILKKDDNINTIITYNFPAIPLLRISRFCRKNNIICLSDTTEWYSIKNYRGIRKVLKYLDVTLRMRYSNFKVDGVIVQSKFLKEFYDKKNLPTLIIPGLYENKENKLNTSTESGIKFIYAGSPFSALKRRGGIEVKERLDLILELLNKIDDKFNDYRLDIYGVTKHDYLKVYSSHKKLLDKSSGVINFHGRQPYEFVKEKIRESDFSIFLRDESRPNLAGFPTKFSESISLGTPVICNKMSSYESYMVEGQNSFALSINNEQERINKISDILNMDRKSIIEMQRTCIESQIFSPEKFKNPLKKFLAQLEYTK